MSDSEFQHVLESAQAGDDAAWHGIVEHYSPALLAYIRRQGSGDPEDALSELWISAARTINAFQGTEPAFRSWLFVIAHRRAIDEGRKASRRPTPLATLPEGPSRSGASVEDRAIAAASQDNVAALLSNLTEDQRSVVLLRVIGDLSLQETAEILGKRVGAVKALQRRALEGLRKMLDDPTVSF